MLYIQSATDSGKRLTESSNYVYKLFLIESENMKGFDIDFGPPPPDRCPLVPMDRYKR